MARDPKPLSRSIKCIVHFLDNLEATFDVDKRDKARNLLDRAFQHLQLEETDYFGLQFSEASSSSEDAVSKVHSPDVVRWLDPNKSIKKQVKALSSPYEFRFRVKYYVANPHWLKDEYTRYQLFLQLTKDLMDGRLVAPYNTAVLLASYAIQSELGDYNPEEHVSTAYLDEFRFLPDQTLDMLVDVAALHRQHRGLSPVFCELQYIDEARKLSSYGIQLFRATWDQLDDEEIELGVHGSGLAVFQGHARIHSFAWSHIVKISFKRKQFLVHLRKGLDESTDNMYGFNMSSYRACKSLWRSCVEHHTFFSQLQQQQQQSMVVAAGMRESSAFTDSLQFEQTYEHPFGRRDPSDYLTSIDNHNVSAPTAVMQSQYASPYNTNPCMPHCACGTPDYRGGRCTHCHLEHHREQFSSNNDGLMSVSGGTQCNAADLNGVNHGLRTYVGVSLPNGGIQFRGLPRGSGGAARLEGARAGEQSKGGQPERASRSAGVESRLSDLSEQSSDDEGVGGDLRALDNSVKASPPSLETSTGSFTTQSPTEQFYDLPTYNNESNTMNGEAYYESHGLVTIHMRPDTRGTFGFNVKGGSDQMMPILVSRVAPGSPADLCTPRLTEGYQVLFINGRDVSEHTHAQVVQFIRASRETHSGELVLVVRPNVYQSENSQLEPDYQYTPEDMLSPPQPIPVNSYSAGLGRHPGPLRGSDPLSESISVLQQSLDCDTAVAQFELVYRKKPGMTMNDALLAENVARNRYRDILPYDLTRVRLKGTQLDYINANYVNMLITGSGVVNRYIAAQGPLPETCADFWQMIWEQRSSLVVMLTTVTERGRVKCHQYWPDLDTIVRYRDLNVACVREDKTASFEFRDFVVSRVPAKTEKIWKLNGKKSADGGGGVERHHVHQIQYLSWPDHGVPDDSADFLDFVANVRRNRAGVVEPIVVHCSAGIGRTGVLISMETAMCTIEANEPVKLLDIVRLMRDQRAMLIQTSDQYKFVCGAIVKVFDERIVEPVEDLK